jgi:hypothetical protein
MNKAMKPTPNIHTCMAIVLSSILKNIFDYRQNGPESNAKKRDLLSPLVHDSQNGIAFAPFSTPEAKINLK